MNAPVVISGSLFVRLVDAWYATVDEVDGIQYASIDGVNFARVIA